MTSRPPAALPSSFAVTRDALHQVAFFAVAPRRYEAEGRLGLVATPGGFGTPWFDTDAGRARVVVAGTDLVAESAGASGEEEPRTPLTTVREACAFLRLEYRQTWFADFHDPLAPVDHDEPLDVDRSAAEALAHWFAFGTESLDQFVRGDDAVDPSTVQLWPEHFDPAAEAGSQEAGQRASYGASPGDAAHPEPSLYVAPWAAHAPHDFWNDDAFGGASLTRADLTGVANPLERAVAFLRTGHDVLAG